MKPFSSPYLKDKIISTLSKKTDKNFVINDVLVSFTLNGLVKVDLSGVSSDNFSNLIEDYSLKIPKISLAIPIYRILFLNFSPSTLIVNDTSFTLNSDDFALFDDKNSASSGDPKYKVLDGLKSSSISPLLESIETINLRNISFKVKNDVKGDISFVIPRSEIRIKNGGNIKISNNTQIETLINDEIKQIEVTSRCNFKKVTLYGNCRFFISSVDLNIFSKLSAKKNIFDNIHSKSSIGAVFSKDKKNKKIIVNASSTYFNIFLNKIFSDALSLEDFEFDMTYDFFEDLLKVENLSSSIDFEKYKKVKNLQKIKTTLRSNFTISGLKKFNSSDISIQLENVDASDIKKLWPIFLPRQNIRSWVTHKISAGEISSSFINLRLEPNKDNSKVIIKSLSSELFGSNIELNYSKNFPAAKKMNLKANFDKNSMKIMVDSAKILSSNIANATISINDFHDPLLNVSLDVEGPSIDLFKHINYNSKNLSNIFRKFFDKSTAKSNVILALPLLKSKLNLNNTSIEVDSKLSNIENNLFAGEIAIFSSKKANADNFESNINFDNAFTHKPNLFNIKKLHADKMGVNFKIAVKSGILSLPSLSVEFNGLKDVIKMSLDYDLRDGKFNNIHLSNRGFNNDYVFNHNYSKSNKVSNFSLSGDSIFINFSKYGNNQKKSSAPLLETLRLNNFYLTANVESVKNQHINSNDVRIMLKCQKYVCSKGFFLSGYQNTSVLTNLNIAKIDKDSYKLSGNIYDTGYLLDLYGISKSIKDGSISLDLDQIVNDNGNVVYNGNISLDSDITVYNNDSIKELESDALFFKIKDKIFSNNKTTFSRLKSDFIINPYSSIIKVNSLIANNYKIGITSKGYLDYKSGGTRLEGAIIPGYLINNLFGIGNIPILGDIVSGVLTGGKNSGLFGLNYEYKRSSYDAKVKFKTLPAKSFIPSSIKNLFGD